MRQTSTASAGVPLRAAVVALLLAGLGLWQAWSCTDGMPASPLTVTTMTAAVPAHGLAGHASKPVTTTDHHHDPATPAGMAGLCITVLAGLAAAFLLLSSPLKLLGLLRLMANLLTRPVGNPTRAPALARLCVSRT